MAPLIQILRFINISAAAVGAGGLLMVLMVIVPAKRAMDARQSVLIHLAMLCGQPDRFMKPAGITAGLSGVVLLILLRNHTPAEIALLAVGLVGSLGVVSFSHFFNVKTNALIQSWSPETVPPNYPEVRNTWDRIHTVRTAAGLLAFVGYLTSALVH
jgi:uncharacterized membrane protein